MTTVWNPSDVAMEPAMASSRADCSVPSRTSRVTSRRPRRRSMVDGFSGMVRQMDRPGWSRGVGPSSRFVGTMRELLDRKSVFVAISAVFLTACGQAGEPSVDIPARATALAIAPDYAGTIWATAGSHVFRSRDGGHSWHGVAHTGAVGVAFLEKAVVLVDGTNVGVGGFGAGRLAEHPAGRSIVAISSPYYRTNRLYGLDSSGGLWLSVRSGRPWAPLRAAGLPNGCGAVAAVRGDPLKADVVYVACGPAGLWRSADFGASFTRLAASPDATAVATTTDDHLRVLVADADGLAVSTNAGKTFRRVARVQGVSAVAFDLRNYLVCYAAAGHTLLRSADGGVTWELPN